MRFIKKHKNGFSLAETLVILLLVSVALAATIPIITKKKPIGVSENAINCIFNGAADIIFNATTGNITLPLPSSGNCYAAYHGCETGEGGDCNTLITYADGAGTADQKTAALKILRASCDQGGEDACNYFLSRCFSNSTNCTDPDPKYTLRYYLNLPLADVNSGKTIIQNKGGNYYSWNMTTLVDEINTVCDSYTESTACAMKITSGGCTSNPGDSCEDGTIFAGTYSGSNIFTTPTDAGSPCWNDCVDGHWTSIDAVSLDDGATNTATLISAVDGSPEQAPPHQAALACEQLNIINAYGHNDWYLPAKNELNVIMQNRDAIGGFVNNVDYWYYSSSRETITDIWAQRSSNAEQNTLVMTCTYPWCNTRCIRKE